MSANIESWAHGSVAGQGDNRMRTRRENPSDQLLRNRSAQSAQSSPHHVLEVDLLGTVDVGGIGENAHGHARTRHMRELDGTGLGARETKRQISSKSLRHVNRTDVGTYETLVTLRVVT
jgi:hypothetical protein